MLYYVQCGGHAPPVAGHEATGVKTLKFSAHVTVYGDP